MDTVEIEHLLEGRLVELRADMDRCRAGLRAMREQANGNTTSSTQPAASRRRRRTGARAGLVTDEQVIEALEKHTRAKDVANALGVNYKTLLDRLRRLERDGKVRREGERRETRWLPAVAA